MQKIIDRIINNSHWEGECLICDYSLSRGYPGITVGGRKGKRMLCHRLMFENHIGRPIADGMDIAHKPIICHNKRCVNPLHLSEKTRKENLADRILDNTVLKGENHPNSILTEEEVKIIKKDNRSLNDIAKDYDVSSSTIYKIQNGSVWKDVIS